MFVCERRDGILLKKELKVRNPTKDSDAAFDSTGHKFPSHEDDDVDSHEVLLRIPLQKKL